MHASQTNDAGGDPRTQFAAERTLLAWIRTGLAMMGFGFVVARFGLFLRELATEQGVAMQHRTSVSLWAGTALVVLGVVVNLCAALIHCQTVKRLSRNEPLQFRPISLGVIVAIALAVLGLAVASYLMSGLFAPA